LTLLFISMSGCHPPAFKHPGNIMDRRETCLVQAAMCRDRAEKDQLHRDYWVDRAIKWLEQARALRTPTENETAPEKASNGPV